MTLPFLSVLLSCALLPQAPAAQQQPPKPSTQQVSPDSPASKEDIERYMEVTHSRDLMKQMMDVVSKQVHELVKQQIANSPQKLPPDVESRVTKMTDDMLRDFPTDQLLEAMVPVYQKHWTKGDIAAILAFYSSPTGQKMVHEMPVIMGEAMQAVQPIMEKEMAKMTDRVQEEMAKMIKESEAPAKPKSN